MASSSKSNLTFGQHNFSDNPTLNDSTQKVKKDDELPDPITLTSFSWIIREENSADSHDIPIRYIQKIDSENDISWLEFLTLLQDNSEFRLFFTQVLTKQPFEAFCWECAPITEILAETRFFSYVTIPCVSLVGLEQNPTPFKRQLERTVGDDRLIVSFRNLSNDAFLVVPRQAPHYVSAEYSHLGAFLRTAPDYQIHEFWRAVAITTKTALSPEPLWLSTAGLGVHWLHVRISSTPKYYKFYPFSEMITLKNQKTPLSFQDTELRR